MSTQVKIVTFVPLTHADAVRQALGEAGAGEIGEYTFCSFSSRGEGRFVPSAGAQPHIGAAGEAEVVEEERIEVVCERAVARAAIAAMKAAHPYEEVAFDVYALLSEGELE